jgi:hypothetical protein
MSPFQVGDTVQPKSRSPQMTHHRRWRTRNVAFAIGAVNLMIPAVTSGDWRLALMYSGAILLVGSLLEVGARGADD